jgi:hypothetical protein
MKLATSALGTKRTSAIAPMMSVVRGKAEVGFQGSHAPFDPFETLRPFKAPLRTCGATKISPLLLRHTIPATARREFVRTF